MGWYFSDLAKQRIKRFIENNYERIDVKGGNCRFNYKCHLNTVHEAIENKQNKLAMCIYMDDDYPIIHFVNCNKDEFIDNTLGHWATQYDYYLIKYIEKKDFFNIVKIFLQYRQELRNKLGILRILTNIKN